MTSISQCFFATVPPTPRMTVESDPVRGRLTIALEGDLDCATAPTLSARMRTILDRRPVRQVVIDVAGLEFCDIAGARMFLHLRQEVTGSGAAYWLRGPRAHIRWLLLHLDAGHLLEPAGEP
ncbi:STAS domain-containing protein [Actinoplanes sp. NPDC051346]|uniref:STAS domain-containing protein n=1 Tax=Actinoplanes sp. NPDC051346 TaxID=3155048 RepID=UPI0034237DAA